MQLRSATRRQTDDDTFEWTPRRTALTTAGGALAVATGITLGTVSDVPVLPEALDLLGAVALVVAVSGRIGTASYLRYRDIPLAQPPTAAPGTSSPGTSSPGTSSPGTSSPGTSSPGTASLGMAGPGTNSPSTASPGTGSPGTGSPGTGSGPRRRAVRRPSTIAWLAMAIFALPLLPAVAGSYTAGHLDRQPDDWFGLIGVLPLLAACWLAGPAARFVVDGRHLHIDTGLRRTSVPRALLAGFSPYGEEIRLDLLDGRRVKFRPDSFLWDVSSNYAMTYTRHNERCQVRTVAHIVRMLHEVPAATAGDPDIHRHWRRGPIAVAITAGLVAPLALALALR